MNYRVEKLREGPLVFFQNSKFVFERPKLAPILQRSLPGCLRSSSFGKAFLHEYTQAPQ